MRDGPNWGLIFTGGCIGILVIMMIGFYRIKDKLEDIASFAPSLQVARVEMDVIRTEAEPITTAKLAAEVAKHGKDAGQINQSKWFRLEGEMMWLQDYDGNVANSSGFDPGEGFAYWLSDGITMLDLTDGKPPVTEGQMLVCWGKLSVLPADELGLEPSARGRMKADFGYSDGDMVPVFFAKLVEAADTADGIPDN